MEAIRKSQVKSKNHINKSHISGQKSHVSDAANDLLSESKKLANELYEEGLSKLSGAEDQVKEYSDQFLKKIQKNPLSSVLIAGGVGFLLSKLLKR